MPSVEAASLVHAAPGDDEAPCTPAAAAPAAAPPPAADDVSAGGQQGAREAENKLPKHPSRLATSAPSCMMHSTWSGWSKWVVCCS